MSTPAIPARPARSQQTGVPSGTQDQPRIPPRPIRKTDPSPDREHFTRSPLNDLPGINGGIGSPPPRPSSTLNPDAPRRPPSISLPSDAGQEGFEYDSYDQLPPEAHGLKGLPATSEQTRNISVDMPLHAPKASFAPSTATSRIASVTRTDSTQAAAAGIGEARPDDDTHMTPTDSQPMTRVTSRTYDDHPRRAPSTEPHPLRVRASFNRSSSSLPRPPSVHSTDHHHEGIPTHGMYVPLLADRGDVQAPSPGPPQPQHAPGIGFFADGSARNHHRKRSSRNEFAPPDSYGLHGHGIMPQDHFEREWVSKHPQEAVKQGYATFTPRPATALSTDQLNKLVHMNQDVGMGTNRGMIGTPTQHEIAFDATDMFNSRMSTPANAEGRKRGSSGQQPPMEAPLRKALSNAGGSAYESEDEHVYHIDPHYKRGSKITGGGAHDGALDLGPHGGNTPEKGGWFVEEGDGTPILASDEITKRPGSAYMEPAVNPEYHDYDNEYQPNGRRKSVDPSSRPSSRPSSVHGGIRDYHGGPLHRYISHEHHDSSGMGTPLEEIEEYEPLFPEDEKPRDPLLKARPSLAHHHFPSQDIWEDTPSSLQYQTTVETPEPPVEKIAAAGGRPEAVFETPEQEQRRRDANPADMTSSDKTFAKPHFKAGVLEELHAARPGVQRFPSSDIWEDTPDSMHLETTVSGPQMDEVKSPPEERPTTNALADSQDVGNARSTTTGIQPAMPSIPSRPTRQSKLAQEITSDTEAQTDEVADLGVSKVKSPPIPERPKPSIPSRPARNANQDQSEPSPLAKSVSAHSDTSSNDTVTSPPLTKAKPAIPARPAGSKIAALQAGFMSDLNKRLQLGPQGPPSKAREPDVEDETEKAPLADARKSRAKGPARRSKPSAADSSPLGFSFSSPMTLFQIDESDEVTIGAADEPRPRTAEIEKVLSANTVSNTSEAVWSSSQPAAGEEPSIEEKLTLAEAVGAEGDLPEPSLASSSVDKADAIQPELETALAHAEPAPASAEESVPSKE